MTPRWLLAFALGLGVLGLLGFSGSSWLHGVRYEDRLFTLEERRAQREVWGTSRGIRSDEWGVETPQVRAQQLAGFPLVNLNEGLGELQRNTYDIPVLDWGVPFRPLTWPYLLKARWSHGLRWFLRDLLLLFGVYGLLVAFVEDKRVAAVAAVAVLFSSAFVWWRSTVMIEFVGFLCLTGAVAARALRDRRPGWFALTFWCAACSFCVFYPPVWAPMLWVVCGVIADVSWRRRRLWAGAALIGLIAAGAAFGIYYHLPYLSLVASTVYPGGRIAGAGDLPLARLVEMVWPSLTAAAPVNCGGERYLGLVPNNVCEASSIEVLPLAVLPALAAVSARVRRAFASLWARCPASLITFGVLTAWLFLPMPQWFGTVTLLLWSPTARAFIGYGILVALLVSHLLASLRSDPEAEPLRWRGAVGVAVVLGCAFAAKEHIDLGLVTGCHARAWFPPIVVAAILLAAGSMRVGTPKGATLLLVAWVVSVILANHRVNPIIHSAQMFSKGKGHEAVDRALADAPGRVMDYSTHFGTQLAAFGWPMLGGVHNSPDLELFRFLAPESPGLTEEVYNRYNHYSFELPPATSRILTPDSIRVAIDPCSHRVAALGVNHFLMKADSAPSPSCALEWTSQPAGEFRLWSRRTPVCAVGVAPAGAQRVLDFDYSCPSEARLVGGRAGFALEVPPDPTRSWAVAINPSAVGSLECTHASGRWVGAHLIVQPETGGAASCRGRYLDSAAALRRLMKR